MLVISVRASYVCAFVSLFFAGCAQEITAPPPVIPEVTVAKPVIENLSRYSLLTGRAEASEVFEAKARVEGFLERVEFEEGSLVKKDQLLLEIERKQYEASLGEAEAAKLQAETAKGLATANLERANAANARQAGTISAKEIDVYKAELAGAEAQITRDEQNIIKATNTLDYTRIYAPFDGMAGILQVDKQNIVGVGEYTLLTTVQKYDPLYVYFDVSESTVLEALSLLRESERTENGKAKAPLMLEVSFENEEGFPRKGYLDVLDNVIDPETGTAIVRGVIPNTVASKEYYERKGELAGPDAGLPQQLPITLPGAYAQIRVVGGEPIENACLVDERAIGTDLLGKYILTVDASNVVHLNRIEMGQLYNGFRHIIRMWDPEVDASSPGVGEVDARGKGFSTDFNYVLLGLQRARPGKEVKTTVVESKYIAPSAPSNEPEKTNEAEAAEPEKPEGEL